MTRRLAALFACLALLSACANAHRDELADDPLDDASITQGAIPYKETADCVPPPPRPLPLASQVPDPSAGARSLVDRQQDALNGVSSEMRAFLDTQPWASEPDPAETPVVDLIAQVEKCRASMAAYRQDDGYVSILDIIKEVSVAPWYADGLSTDERATLASIFRLYIDLSKIHLGSPSVVADPGRLLIDSLQRETSGAVQLPRSGHRTLFVLADNAAQAREVFRRTADILPVIEGFASTLQPRGVAIVILPVDSLCGQTPSGGSQDATQLIFIGTKCLRPIAVYHELTHAFLGAGYPGWYTEGMADFLASYLTDSLDQTYADYHRLQELGGEERVNLNQRFDGLVAAPQYAAGYIFLREVYGILGYENMGVLARGLRPTATGTTILDAIRRLAPLDQREALETIISRRVDTTQ